MLWTQDELERKSFSLELNGKMIHHKTELTILRNLLSDSLAWDQPLKKVLIPALRNRVRTLRTVAKYMDPGFKARFTNLIFCSKLMFRLETWGACPKTLLSKLQSLQDQAAKYHNKTLRQMLLLLN